MLRNNRFRQEDIVVVELVGPAGAGKTTLSQVLVQCSEKIVVGAEISLRNKEHLLVFLQNFHSVLPILMARNESGRSFTWDEVKAMAYLKGWPRILRQQVARRNIIVLLDQGPIFKLATLYAFGPERLRSQAFKKWWNDMFEEWAVLLDMVVWLDAPNPVLEKRINYRDQRHAVKGRPEPEAREFLEQYRTSYEQMLARLTADGGPILFQFDTSQTSIEQIAENVLDACKIKTVGI
jgi:deoxyadenosine/deoxycytidine kinase